MRAWMLRNPRAVGLVVTVLMSWMAMEIFDIGREIGAARMLDDDLARMRSESLGG